MTPKVYTFRDGTIPVLLPLGGGVREIPGGTSILPVTIPDKEITNLPESSVLYGTDSAPRLSR